MFENFSGKLQKIALQEQDPTYGEKTIELPFIAFMETPTTEQDENDMDKISAGGVLTAVVHSQEQESKMHKLVDVLVDELNERFVNYKYAKHRLEFLEKKMT